MGHVHILLDEMGLDEMGLDDMGLDEMARHQLMMERSIKIRGGLRCA